MERGRAMESEEMERRRAMERGRESYGKDEGKRWREGRVSDGE